VNHLLRSLAPISDAGWELIDDEARERLTAALAARKLVDFSGPRGWGHSASRIGRTSALQASPVDGVRAAQRRVLPLVELRRDFELSRDELRDGDRGAPDVDLQSLDQAAQEVARAENVRRRASPASPRHRRTPRSRWPTTQTTTRARSPRRSR
jgi:uncharacterized linocin/CFP29 family protein